MSRITSAIINPAHQGNDAEFGWILGKEFSQNVPFGQLAESHSQIFNSA